MPTAGPSVSVIVPAYGVAAWIGEAVGSALSQTVPALEVIVINDGSPDGEDLERALEPVREQITYLSQPNRGAAAARNLGLSVARGEWVAFLDGDDVWEERFLEKQLAFAAREGLGMTWSNCTIIGDTPNAGSVMIDARGNDGLLSTQDLLTGAVTVATSATLVKLEHLRAAGGFDERLVRAQDFELWVRLMLQGVRARFNPLVLARYRVRPGNLSGDRASQLARAIHILKDIDTRLALPEADREALRSRLRVLEALRELAVARERITERRYQEARVHLRTANQVLRSPKLGAVVVGLGAVPALIRWLILRLAPDDTT